MSNGVSEQMVVTKQAIREIKDATKLVGFCEYCEYHETDGEQGQIRSCCHPLLVDLDDLPSEIYQYLMDNNKCPFWLCSSGISTGFCKSHNLFFALSLIGCKECWEEFVNREQQKEGPNVSK